MLVIIEGSDFSGKTTIAGILKPMLSDITGKTIVASSTCLTQGIISRIVQKVQDSRYPQLVKSFIFTIAILIDTLSWKDKKDAIFIQQSYVNRMLAFRKANGGFLGFWFLWLMKRIQRKPDIGFLLMASFETRKQRYEQGTAFNVRDHIRFNQRSEFQISMDDYLIAFCMKDGYICVNTEIAAFGECVSLICNEIITNGKRYN